MKPLLEVADVRAVIDGGETFTVEFRGEERGPLSDQTRREAAELCQMAPLQAGRLLKRLVSGGELRLQGTRRSAYYERPT